MFLLVCATLLLSAKGRDTAEVATTTHEVPRCQGEAWVGLSQAEVTGEAGLCVLMTCSLTTNHNFSAENVTWHKCNASEQNCTYPEVVLAPSSNLEGRASLLESDPSKGNCSILINDLRESDSGFYRVRVVGRLSGKDGRCELSGGASVSVKGLSQRPTVSVPPLTDGQQATLTCTAPAICSGSPPNITWAWRGGGAGEAHIAGSSSAETVSAITDHSSALTFTSSAEHHGRSLTCTVTFAGGATTEDTVTLNVTYARELKINGNTSVEEGDALNVTCSIESHPPLQIQWTKQGQSSVSLGNGTGAANLLIPNVTKENAGSYVCTAMHPNKKLTNTITVIVKNLNTENTAAKPSNDLDLTCSSENFPLFLNTWAKKNKLPQIGSAKAIVVIAVGAMEGSWQYNCMSVQSGNRTVDVTVMDKNWTKTSGVGQNADVPCRASGTSPYAVTRSGSQLNTKQQSTKKKATFIIPNMGAGRPVLYECATQHKDKPLTLSVNVSITFHPKVLQAGSECTIQSGVLTCACVSWGFPLPTIRWPLLKNHTEYSVTTTVSNYTVNSTATLTGISSGNMVRCVSSNENGEVEVDLHVKKKEEQDDPKMKLLRSVMRLEILVAFLIGTLFSIILAFFCCCMKNLYRKNKKRSNYGQLDQTLEMVPTQDVPLIYTSEADENNQSQDKEADARVGAEAEGKSDVDYSSVNFSMLGRKASTQATSLQRTTETEYAEIKKEKQRQRGEGHEGEEELVMIEEEGDTEQREAEENEENLYSNLNDMMEEI